MKITNISEIFKIYNQPLFLLLSQANQVHVQHHDPQKVQACSLISIKTGGCPEDCKYCSQSSYYKTAINAQPLMEIESVLEKAKAAISKGATRVCLGAAWREVRDNAQFERVLEMIKSITALGVEVCCTLGMLQDHQAKKLKEAGLYAYNHNLDSSEKFYKTIISTRTYQDRIRTIDVVQQNNISLCCGCIIGMGEKIEDRLEFLHTLTQREIMPESIPINFLYPVPGTPMQDKKPASIWEMIRMIATARILFPKAMVRLSCGREKLTHEQHALCFLAGANSLFLNDGYLLTKAVLNPSIDQDEKMFELFELKKQHSR